MKKGSISDQKLTGAGSQQKNKRRSDWWRRVSDAFVDHTKNLWAASRGTSEPTPRPGPAVATKQTVSKRAGAGGLPTHVSAATRSTAQVARRGRSGGRVGTRSRRKKHLLVPGGPGRPPQAKIFSREFSRDECKRFKKCVYELS
jgi:hypothetical protein